MFFLSNACKRKIGLHHPDILENEYQVTNHDRFRPGYVSLRLFPRTEVRGELIGLDLSLPQVISASGRFLELALVEFNVAPVPLHR